MANAKRTPVLTGNWKMHKTIEQSAQFIESLAAKISASQVTHTSLWLSVPFTAISSLAKLVQEKGWPFWIGAQNMHDVQEGAFTGEIAVSMLQEVGARFVLLGHSERRHIFGEKNDFINKKVLRALASGITPVLCVGENLAQRERGETFSLIESQLTECLHGVEDPQSLMLAYEPVWAVGTGKVATPEEAEEVHRFCRENLAKRFGEEKASQIVIQYGGSVRADNAASLLAQENIDGLLVGGASLNVDSFFEILKQCEQCV